MARLFVEFENGTPREKMMEVITTHGCTLVYEVPGDPPTLIVSVPDGAEQEYVDRLNSLSHIRVKAYGDIHLALFK
jgi:hypothetical protein